MAPTWSKPHMKQSLDAAGFKQKGVDWSRDLTKKDQTIYIGDISKKPSHTTKNRWLVWLNTPKFSDTHVNTLHWMTRRVPPVPWKWRWGSPEFFHSAFFSGGKRLSGHDLGIPKSWYHPLKLANQHLIFGVLEYDDPFLLGPLKTASFQGRFFAVSFQRGVNKLPFWLKLFCCSPGLKDLNKLFFVAFKNECFPKIVEDVVCATRFLWPCSVVSPLLFSYIQYIPSNRLQTSDSYSPTALNLSVTFPQA